MLHEIDKIGALKYFATIIENELGIVYSEFNYFQLESRLDSIVKFKGLSSIYELYQLVQSNLSKDILQLLLDIATNNETSFFRDPKVFGLIEKKIIPELVKNKNGEKINIWSAACSTGQEVLTLLIILNEISLRMENKISYSILASDASETALQKAQNACFNQIEVQRGLPAKYLIKYFQKNEKDEWIFDKEKLNNVKFNLINLKKYKDIEQKFDLILCRNILIYQNIENKIKIVNYLENHLVEDGKLILGGGESLLGINKSFRSIIEDDAIYYSKNIAQRKVG